MKILKQGDKNQNKWSKKFTCSGKGNGRPGCGAELLVEEGDLFQTHSSHYDGSNEIYTTFRCSHCRVLTDVEGRDYPTYVEVHKDEKAYDKWCESFNYDVK